MSEAYQQKEWELNSLIDNLNSIEYTYEEYKKEVECFIDRLLEDTKEINTLREENKRLNKSLEEQRHFYLEKIQQKENIIKEVREYIETKYDYLLGDDTFLDHDERIDRKQIKHILGILQGSDKE